MDKNEAINVIIDVINKVKANDDGTFCNQTTEFEDCYHGEFYLKIEDDRWLQIHYNC